MRFDCDGVLVHVVPTGSSTPYKLIAVFVEVHVTDGAFALNRFAFS